MCEDSFVGILDDKTLSILRDGRVIGTMHKLSERDADRASAAERGVRLEVRVRDKHGVEHKKRVILKKVSR